MMQNVIPLSRQLKYFKEYQTKLAEMAGNSQARSIITGALYVICSASNDFGLNYYINPLLFKTMTVDQFSDLIVSILSDTVTVRNINLSWFYFVYSKFVIVGAAL